MTTARRQYFFFPKQWINCLPLQDRKRRNSEDTKFKICNQEDEDLAHFLLACPEQAEKRNMGTLQQPFQENRKNIGEFVYEEEKTEEKKNIVYKW